MSMWKKIIINGEVYVRESDLPTTQKLLNMDKALNEFAGFIMISTSIITVVCMVIIVISNL